MAKSITYLFLLPVLWVSVVSGEPLPSGEKSNVSKPFETRTTKIGPWGAIEYSRLILEPSDSYVNQSEDLKNPQNETVWSLSADGPDRVCQILEEAGFETDTVAELTRPDRMIRNPETGWFEVRPPENVILEMTQQQRAYLYPMLQPLDQKNPFHTPFALPPGGIRAVATTPTGLPGEAMELIEQLTYQKSKANRFSDIGLLFSKIESNEERVRALKVLAREPALSARLIVDPQSNLAALESYWSAGGRNREILPLLRSVASAHQVDRLDIAHLLPPTPRKLVHTYPTPWGYGINSDTPDCFWTAFSFFSDDPPDRHLDFTTHVFEERYEPARAPFQFGDLLLIRDAETGEWIHACNLIAEDLVFTKNGRSMGRAWIISTLPEVVNSYFNTENIQVSLHRLKPTFLR